MGHSVYCPNPLCQATNSIGQRSCKNCGTNIPHHYLWIPNHQGTSDRSIGDLIDDRYLITAQQIVLDTKPSHIQVFTEDVNDIAIRYAELFPYKSNIPQIYAYFQVGDKYYELLENNAIYQNYSHGYKSTIQPGQLMPEMAELWPTASLEQQISWISQILDLWQPLSRLSLAETLLRPELLRVDVGQLRVLHLEADQSTNPSIADFAVVWGDLLDWGYTTFWRNISRQMIQGEILNSEVAFQTLDQQMKLIHESSGSQNFDVDIATLTDQGPNRPENQDACYPKSNTYLKSYSNQNPWLVVCDGIGGHEGGSIASKLAIQTIEQSLMAANLANCSDEDVEVALEQAIFAANDVICQLNDQEEREAKQRMGTTAVLAYVRSNRLFISHVGDSRAYRVTLTSCRQVTVDDDLASREAMYGSAFYREALQYPGTGALTQALGMSASAQLQPTTQRFWLTEPCIYLLCSDGLSDFDLVDRVWAAELSPVFNDRAQLRPACQRLVTLANQQNGHDNVTVGLLHIIRPSPLSHTAPETQVESPQSVTQRVSPTVAKTQVVVQPQRSGWLKAGFFGLLALGLFGGMTFAWWRAQQNNIATVPATSTPSPTVDADSLQQVNQILQVKPGPVPLVLLPKPDPTATTVPVKIGDLAPGSIVQVKSQLTTANQQSWVKLQVCSVPTGETSGTAALPAKMQGWQSVAQIAEQVTLATALPPEQLGNCDPQGANAPSGLPVPAPTREPNSAIPLPETPNQAQ